MEMIIENVDEEIALIIVRTFEIHSCVRGLHFFQDPWQPKLLRNFEKFFLIRERTKFK